jgi:DNA-binding MarR family transcriptional regulator
LEAEGSYDEVTDAVVAASRVLVAVAARSLSAVNSDVTLAQYRTLVVLASRGRRPLGFLAEQLDVTPSTATRMCDRLVRKGLVDRRPSESSRREIEISITAEGRAIVDRVTRRRRREIARILGSIPDRHRTGLVEALNAFAEAAGEVPEQAWSLGWSA